MSRGKYLRYYFEHRSEYGNKIGLVEIISSDSLPRNAKRMYDTIYPVWRMPHTIDAGVIRWSWIVRTEDDKNDLYTGIREPGGYKHLFIPQLERRKRNDDLKHDIR